MARNYSTSVTSSINYIPFNLSASEGLTLNIDNPNQGSSYVVLETRRNSDGFYDENTPKNTQGTYTLDGVTNIVSDNYKTGFVIPSGGGTASFDNTNYISGSDFRVVGTKYHPFYDALLDRWPNAAVAYSLRRLNSYYDGPAVRVRRSIDDEEENINFIDTSLDTTSLTNFATNAGTALPADYGDGAGAAYSLRYVSSTYTSPVVRVRRDSDDAELDFTPSEITDGTLEAWVNENTNVYTSDFTSGNDGINQKLEGTGNIDDILGVDDTLRLRIKTGNEEWWAQKGGILTAGNSYTISFDIYIPASNTQIDNVRIGSTGNGTDVVTVNTVGEWTTVTASFTALGSALGIRAYDGNAGYFNGNGTDVFYMKNIEVTQTAGNGFVETWYDQSGNGNDASQTTAASQPKIVDSSTGVVLENGKPALSFDGSNDYMIGDSFLSQNEFLIFKPVLSTNGRILQLRNTTDNLLMVTADGRIRKDTNDSTFNGPLWSASTNQTLISTINSTTAYEDSVLITATNSVSYGLGSGNNLFIGCRSDLSIFFNGLQQELIFYNSDQSSNRTDIESNINNYYNIFPFDAYVETWYDQSGNGRNATQTTDANQPQIVSSGSVILEGANPTVQFATNNDDNFFFHLYNDSISVNQPFTTFISAYRSTTNDRQSVFTEYQGTSWRAVVHVSGGRIMQAGLSLFTGNISIGKKLYYNLFNGSSSEFSENQGTLYTGDAGTNNIADLSIGGYSGNYNWIGNIQEIILYPSDQSSNRSGIESDINSHYKIY